MSDEQWYIAQGKTACGACGAEFESLDLYKLHTCIERELEECLPICGCGQPVGVKNMYRQVLEWIDTPPSAGAAEWSKACDEWQDKLDAILPDKRAQYLIFYVLADRDLTEHGGSVPGWLTDKGKRMLKQMQEGKDADWRE